MQALSRSVRAAHGLVTANEAFQAARASHGTWPLAALVARAAAINAHPATADLCADAVMLARTLAQGLIVPPSVDPYAELVSRLPGPGIWGKPARLRTGRWWFGDSLWEPRGPEPDGVSLSGAFVMAGPTDEVAMDELRERGWP